MEVKNQPGKKNPKADSVLQGDGFYFNRILSRESSVGQSSRIYYSRSAEGVPFKWEMQPGTPKNPPPEEIIPPPSPSPLMQSLGLPAPRDNTTRPKDWLRKKINKIQIHTWFLQILSQKTRNNPNRNYLPKNQNDKWLQTDSFTSSSGGHVLERDPVDGHLSCNPWNISSILVRVTRRF